MAANVGGSVGENEHLFILGERDKTILLETIHTLMDSYIETKLELGSPSLLARFHNAGK